MIIFSKYTKSIFKSPKSGRENSFHQNRGYNILIKNVQAHFKHSDKTIYLCMIEINTFTQRHKEKICKLKSFWHFSCVKFQ